MIWRTVSGWARQPISELGRQQNGLVRPLWSRPINRRGIHSSVPTDDEEGQELLDTGIPVSDEEDLGVSIVKCRYPNGPLQRLHSTSS